MRQRMPVGVDDAMQALLDASALRGERAVSLARAVFCSVIGLRAWLLGFEQGGTARQWLTYPPIALAIAFSALSLVAVARGVRPGPLVHLSVAVDAVAAFATLLADVLWPWPGYPGLVNLPDIGVLVLLTLAAGLRGLPSAAALGGVLFGAAFTLLCVLDQANLPAPDIPRAHHHALYGVLIAASSAMAVVFAVRARRLAQDAAQAAVRLDVAGRNYGTLLRDHHDLRGLLGAARLNADRLAQELKGAPSPAEARRLAVAVRDDLSQVHVAIDDLKARAWGELAELEGRAEVELQPAISEVFAGLAPRFPAVEFSGGAAAGHRAQVAGGAASLRRILYNLVLNACEGDGRRGARRVVVTSDRDDGRVCLRIDDDGPGFAPELLTAPVVGRTTKAGSGGLGLTMVAALVEASGGALRLSRRPEGGASVTVRLPLG